MSSGTSTESSEISLSTEAFIDHFYEYSDVWHISDHREVEFSESQSDLTFITVVGIGGILVFIVIFSLCEACYFHLKGCLDEDSRREREHNADHIRRLREIQDPQAFDRRERRPWLFESRPCSPVPPESESNSFPENFHSVFGQSTLQKEGYENFELSERKPSHIEISMRPSTPEKAGRQLPPSTERRIRSSPSSPNVVRRRLYSDDESPRRPSTWWW